MARKLAKKLGFIHLNQGAFFRAAGLKAARTGVDLTSGEQLANLVRETTFALQPVDVAEQSKVVAGFLVDGQNYTEELLSAEAGSLASTIAVYPELRGAILDAQRRTIGSQSAVVEGRDAGSVGFANAELKVYLDAGLSVRAERRFQELQALGAAEGRSLASVTKDIEERDKRDSSRAADPLSVPEGALQIDTSDSSIDEVVEQIVAAVEAKCV